MNVKTKGNKLRTKYRSQRGPNMETNNTGHKEQRSPNFEPKNEESEVQREPILETKSIESLTLKEMMRGKWGEGEREGERWGSEIISN